MAQKIVLVDDITGGPADERVSFALDGEEYEIDLATQGELGADALRGALAQYVKVARRTGGRKSVAKVDSAKVIHMTPRAGRPAAGADMKGARTWAATLAGRKAIEEAGLALPSSRGRVSSRVFDLWVKHRDAPPAPAVEETPDEAPEAPMPAPKRRRTTQKKSAS